MKKTQPKVSVIIPVYNTEKYLRECLDSVVNQTLRDIEIICVDDGSTDGSLEVLREYAASDSRFVILQQENAGAGAARNKGLDIAKGEYLSILDSDDFFEPIMLEKAYNIHVTENCDMVVFRCNRYVEETEEFINCEWTIKQKYFPNKKVFSVNEIEHNIFYPMIFWTWDKLFKRSFTEENHLRFQEIRLHNDMLFTVAYILLSQKISIIDDILVHQRMRSTSLSHEVRNWECVFDALAGVRQFLKEHGLFKKYERDFISYSLNMFVNMKNRISINIYPKFYRLMKEKWILDFEFEKYPKEFYDTPNEYEWMKHVVTTDIEDELVEYIVKERDVNVILKHERDDLCHETDRLRNDLDAVRTDRDRLHHEADRLRNDLECVQRSVSFRVGRKITWLPRKLRGGLRCLRENGFIYTCRRFCQKVTMKTK